MYSARFVLSLRNSLPVLHVLTSVQYLDCSLGGCMVALGMTWCEYVDELHLTCGYFILHVYPDFIVHHLQIRWVALLLLDW